MSTQIKSESLRVTMAVLAFGAAFIAAAVVQGATVTYLGQDTSTRPDWRTATVAKPRAYDPNADHVYGSDGYYVAFWSGSGSGITVQQSIPDYLSSVTPDLPSTYGSGGYAWLNDPSAPTQPTNAAAGLWHTGTTIETDLFDFTLASDVSFVLGVIYDTHDQQVNYNLTEIRVRQWNGSGDSGVQSIASASRIPYYQFFAISGVAGDTFIVSGKGAAGHVTVTGLTFERVPEPSTFALATLGLLGLGLVGWRRRKPRRIGPLHADTASPPPAGQAGGALRWFVPISRAT